MPVLSGLAQRLADPTPLRGRRLGLCAVPPSPHGPGPSSAEALLQAGLPLLCAVQVELESGRVGTAHPSLPTWRLAAGGVRETGPAIDTLVVDLPTTGLRWDPAAAAIEVLLAEAGAQGWTVHVLDRPAPLDGSTLSGNVVHPGFDSELGVRELLLRHGLTTAELVRFLRQEGRHDVAVDVTRATGWHRAATADDDSQTGWAPVLGHPSAAQLALDVGLALVRCTPSPVAYRTAGPMAAVGVGALDPHRVLELCRKGAYDARLDGVGFALAPHRPAAPPALSVEVDPPHAGHGLLTGLVILEALVRAHASDHPGVPFPWLPLPPDTPGRARWAIDRHLGSPEGRLGLESRVSPRELLAAWQPDVDRFADARRVHLLY